MKQLIVDENETRNGKIFPHAFNENSTLFAFFEPEQLSIIIYDLNNDKSVNEKKINTTQFYSIFGIKPILMFLDTTTLIISSDQITYTLWNIQDNGLEYIHLDTKSKGLLVSPQKNYIYFSPESSGHALQIYSIKEKKLTSLEKNSPLNFNTDETYAMQNTKKNRVTLYATKGWKINACFRPPFNNGDIIFSFSQFTPCGKFAVVGWDEAVCLKLYDIEHDIIILESSFHYSSEPKFYKNNLLIFTQNETTLVVYDYRIDKKIELPTEEPITNFSVQGDYLILSSGTQTELYDLSNTTKIRKNMQMFKYFDLNFLYN